MYIMDVIGGKTLVRIGTFYGIHDKYTDEIDWFDTKEDACKKFDEYVRKLEDRDPIY